jgi:uncharacterized membrane protein YhaH (DUF805 family)
MLGFIFGLNARIGRLHYFLSTIGLAAAMAGICFLIALAVYHGHPRATPPSLGAIMWPVIAIGSLFIVISLTLQSMRFRDMGWDPVCVIPAWIAVLVIDALIAKKFPGLALGPHHYTTGISAIVNLGLTLALLFWPSADYDSAPPPLAEPRRPDPAPRSDAGSVAAQRLARAGGGFGRRGV